MPINNVLPLPAHPGFRWSSIVPDATREIITVYDLEELDALNQLPEADIAWAEVGTHTSVGSGVVKVPYRLPQSMMFKQFDYGGDRTYHSVDVGATEVHVNPWDLSFAWPMVIDQMGNGWKLMNQASDGTLTEFMGINGLAGQVVNAGRAYRALLVASLFYKGLTDASLGVTAEALTIAQPGYPNGLPLFTNGVDSPMHFASPMNAKSARFQNLWPGFGPFATKFGASLMKMATKPNPLYPNTTSGARVTDVFGPTWMRDRFWAMAVQTLSLQTTAVPGILGGATINPYAVETLKKFTPDNFIGAAGFTPQRFWIVPQLDSHPYFTANDGEHMTDGPDGGPADMWINVSALPGRATWAKLACNSKDFVPIANYYGPGDPRAMSERRVRLETDLDAGVAAGDYGSIDMFFGV